MKSTLIVLIFSVSLSLAFAESQAQRTSSEKEYIAFQECNVTNPVQRDPAEVLAQAIATGEEINLSQEEKCNLYCFLQKVRFFDANGNINGTGLFHHTLKEVPQLAQYSDVLCTQIYQTIKTTKVIQDKCKKATVAFHQYFQNIFTLALAEGLQNYTDVKNQVTNALIKDEPIPSELEKKVKEYLELVSIIINAFANARNHSTSVQHQTQATPTTNVP